MVSKQICVNISVPHGQCCAESVTAVRVVEIDDGVETVVFENAPLCRFHAREWIENGPKGPFVQKVSEIQPDEKE